MKVFVTSTVIFLLCAVLGCSSRGENRFRLSGEAEFDGKPIAYGDVLFTPDGAKGNNGPQGIAMIRDGKYDTDGSGGKGFAGGPTVIRVTGFEKEGGKLICEYEWKEELPKGTGTFKLQVPKKGAAGGKAPKGDI